MAQTILHCKEALMDFCLVRTASPLETIELPGQNPILVSNSDQFSLDSLKRLH